MSTIDTISDFLTQIRNAGRAGRENVQIRHSNVCEKIGAVLANEGYLSDIQTVGEGTRKFLVIKLKYVDHKHVINNLKRVSKPSRRVYVGHNELKPIMNGMGMAIISTPAGIMTDIEARKKCVGGEVICNIW